MRWHHTREAVAFHVDVLGFELIARMGPALAIVGSDGHELWSSGPQSSVAQPMPDGRLPEPGGRNRLAVEAGDVPGTLRGSARPASPSATSRSAGRAGHGS